MNALKNKEKQEKKNLALQYGFYHLIVEQHLNNVGHIIWLPEKEPARRYTLCIPSHGRLKISYLAYIQRVIGYDENEMAAEGKVTLAKDRCT